MTTQTMLEKVASTIAMECARSAAANVLGAVSYTEVARAALAAPGRSRTGLADFLGLHQSSISKMLSGARQVKAVELERIESYLARTQHLASLDSPNP